MFDLDVIGRVNLDGCIAKDNKLISYSEPPEVYLGKDSTLCEGQEFLLNARVNNGSYLWQDGSRNDYFLVKTPGLYKVTVSNECGSTKDEILITKGVCQFYVPNAFTPNADGRNDVFRATVPPDVLLFRMEVYNRYGELVFSSDDPRKGWNGTVKGATVPTTVFVWQCTLQLPGENPQLHKGTVLLVR